MSEPRQISYISACNLKERRSLEQSDQGPPLRKQEPFQAKTVAKEGNTPLRISTDDSDVEQRTWSFLHGNRSATYDSSKYQPYGYKALASSRFIRLLEIQPGSPNEKILCCRLKGHHYGLCATICCTVICMGNG